MTTETMIHTFEDVGGLTVEARLTFVVSPPEPATRFPVSARLVGIHVTSTTDETTALERCESRDLCEYLDGYLLKTADHEALCERMLDELISC